MSEVGGVTFDFAPGTVLGEDAPRGYRRLLRRSVVGTDRAFADAGRAVLDWTVQRASGIAVRTAEGADAPPAEEGLAGVVVVPALGVGITAPMVVTRVVRERDLVGFAYGTRRGHPEVGEEAFLVRRVGTETVFELRALSRPAFPYSLAAPIGLLLQERFTGRYLRALTGG
ncbi:DUF1990 family protein [uncultured Amnibacterium sp.]|uniref:DUF1990 family protein n=1 Tax=uncultured Amnibacterium sp. TaxID=1631851 RepID=UPI0035CB151E